MRQIPIVVTILVALAALTMVWLGIWQLQRATWKDAVIASAQAALNQPAIAWPAVPVEDGAPIFRRSGLMCLSVEGWRATSGRNRAGDSGWAHIASCRLGAEGPGAQVVAGWSRSADPPVWTGGPVTGTIAPDTRHVIRLIADRAPPGFEPAAPPAIADIPNNHRAYAVQWFVFAGVAVLIYGLALRRRAQR